MKRKLRKLGGIILAVAMLASMMPAAVVNAAPSVSKNQTLYRSSKSSNSYVSIYVNNLGSSTIKKSSVKSSNTSVAKPYSIYDSKYSSKTEYFDGSKARSNSSHYGYIELKASKAGTATVSFKVGSKSYSSKVTVKDYVNPVKSIKISGVNSGKNLASLTKSNSYVSGLTSKTTKNAKVQVTAASGWKITEIYTSDYNSGDHYNYYNNKGKTSATLNAGTFTKGRSYVNVTFTNTKNGASLSTSYNF